MDDSNPPTIGFLSDEQIAADFQIGDHIISTNGYTDFWDFYRYKMLPNVGDDFIYVVQQEGEAPREVVAQGISYTHFIIDFYGFIGVPFAISATIATGVAAITLIAFFALAVLIFWRRSDDWLAILISIMLLILGVELSLDSFNVSFIERNLYGLPPLYWTARLSPFKVKR